MTSLLRRRREPEIQDQLDLDGRLLEGALRGLETINLWSQTPRLLWPAIRELARDVGTLRLLDIACGAGDVATGLWRLAQRAGVPLEVEGCDMNPRTVAFARRRARRQGAGVTFFPLDVLREPIPARFDVIMCSLFLHHLSDADAVGFLRVVAGAARRLVLVSDLERSPGGLALAYFGGRWLADSPVNRVDSVLSVKAAFTVAEARGLAQQAGLAGAAIEWKWPCRYLLTWRRPPLAAWESAIENCPNRSPLPRYSGGEG